MAQKLALIIGNSEYQDPILTRLVTPNEDVSDLAEVLRMPEIGEFDEVTTLVNEPVATILRAIARFFAQKKPDDLLLLYFSGHGVRDDRGHLYLAVKDTEHDLLSGTAIPASFVTGEMDHSRSRQQVLILDCCHSGAFAQGMKGTPGGSVGTASAFQGTGSGRVVLTATDSTQYAWEGDQVIGEAENSVFTRYLIHGLRTGEADRDADGRITLDELYDYVYEQVVNKTPRQTPGKSSYKQQGEIVIARNLRPVVKPVKLPPELQESIEDPRPWVRESAVRELNRLLEGSHPGRALTAHQVLKHIAEEDDSTRVKKAAAEVLQAYTGTQQAKEKEAEAERAAREKGEQERLAREKVEQEQLAAQRTEAEQLAREQAERERLAREKAKAEKLAARKVAQEQLAREKVEQERLAAQQAEAERAEQKRLTREKAKAEEPEAQKAEDEQLAREKAEQERLAREKAQAEKRQIAVQKAEAKRLRQEKEQQERLEREKVETEREHLEQERLQAEWLAKQKTRTELIADEKAKQEQLVSSALTDFRRTEQERPTQEKAKAEWEVEAERIDRNRLLLSLVLAGLLALVFIGLATSSNPPPSSTPTEVLTPTEIQVAVVVEDPNATPTLTPYPITECQSGKTCIRWFVGLGTGTDPGQITVQEEVVADYNASQDEIQLILEVVPHAAGRDTLSTEIASGNGPDIVGPVGWAGANDFYGQWLDIAPLIASNGFDTSIFNSALINAYQSEGEGLVGLPFAVFPGGIFFIPAMFDEAGLAYPPQRYGDKYELDGEQVDWNWDTVTEVAKRLTIDVNGLNATQAGFDKNQIVQVGYNAQWQSFQSVATFYGGANLVYTGDAPGEYQVAIPESWKETWQWYYDGMWDDQPFMAIGPLAGSPEFGGGNVFNSGKAAMALSQTWYTCCLGDLSKTIEWQVGIMPAMSNGEISGRMDADTFRIWKGTKNPDAAFEVLAYLITYGVDKLLPTYGENIVLIMSGIPSKAEAFSLKMAEQYPFVTEESWNVFVQGLAYPDGPSAESWMPSPIEGSARIQAFKNLIETTPPADFDFEAEYQKLVDDLQVIFDKAQ